MTRRHWTILGSLAYIFFLACTFWFFSNEPNSLGLETRRLNDLILVGATFVGLVGVIVFWAGYGETAKEPDTLKTNMKLALCIVLSTILGGVAFLAFASLFLNRYGI